jgi:hypothetical protein
MVMKILSKFLLFLQSSPRPMAMVHDPLFGLPFSIELLPNEEADLA